MEIKKDLKQRLRKIGEQWLRGQGYTISRVPGLGKGSVRRISKGGKHRLAAIRTSQDGHLAFDPKPDGSFSTLDENEVDVVIAVVADDYESVPRNPRFAYVHQFDAKVLSKYFHRAREAREAAGRPPKLGIGMWLAVYVDENPNQLGTIGCGFGNKYPRVDKVPLSSIAEPTTAEPPTAERTVEDQVPVAISKAGGVVKLDIGGVKITIEVPTA